MVLLFPATRLGLRAGRQPVFSPPLLWGAATPDLRMEAVGDLPLPGHSEKARSKAKGITRGKTHASFNFRRQPSCLRSFPDRSLFTSAT